MPKTGRRVGLRTPTRRQFAMGSSGGQPTQLECQQLTGSTGKGENSEEKRQQGLKLRRRDGEKARSRTRGCTPDAAQRRRDVLRRKAPVPTQKKEIPSRGKRRSEEKSVRPRRFGTICAQRPRRREAKRRSHHWQPNLFLGRRTRLRKEKGAWKQMEAKNRGSLPVSNVR